MGRVLVVEDAEDTAAVVAEILALEHEVRCTSDGDEALVCAVGFVPEVVFVDLTLPGISGFEVAKRLRNRARHVAECHEIAAQHTEWEIIGPPEIRDVNGHARHFHPYRMIEHTELMRLQEPQPQINPHLEQPPAIDAAERFLVSVFLGRYVTYCARRRRLAQMQGAVGLYSEIAAG